MSPFVTSIIEAEEFFITHSSGIVTCSKKGKPVQTCDCYPDAKKYFEEE